MSEIKLSAIVAMSENRVIGRDNDLPWHIPEDLKRFKTVTMGKPVVMGRNTFESIFDRIGKPLPGRQNIVLSRSGFEAADVESCKTLDEALSAAKSTAQSDGAEEVMIIGGAQIYALTLPLLDRLYLTVVEKNVEGDAYFPELDETQWRISEDQHYDGDLSYRFLTMDRIK